MGSNQPQETGAKTGRHEASGSNVAGWRWFCWYVGRGHSRWGPYPLHAGTDVDTGPNGNDVTAFLKQSRRNCSPPGGIAPRHGPKAAAPVCARHGAVLEHPSPTRRGITAARTRAILLGGQTSLCKAESLAEWAAECVLSVGRAVPGQYRNAAANKHRGGAAHRVGARKRRRYDYCPFVCCFFQVLTYILVKLTRRMYRPGQVPHLRHPLRIRSVHPRPRIPH